MESLPATRLFPLFADLRGRAVLVVGGGEVARRKIAPLRESGARVQVVARALNAELADLAEAGGIDWIAREYVAEQLDAVWLVVVATDDRTLNAAVAADAEQRRVWANVVDDVELSSWQSPAVVDRVRMNTSASSRVPAMPTGSRIPPCPSTR